MPTPPASSSATTDPAVDPLLAPPTGMERTPLVTDEHAPLLNGKTATLLTISPVGRHMENLDALRIVCMLGIILTHSTGKFLEWADKRHEIDPLFRSVLSLNVACRFGVPCFMMISFFIYWHQLYEKGRSWPELLWRRFKRLGPAFICWSAFYLLVHKWLYHVSGHMWESSLHSFKLRSWHTWVEVFVYGRAEYHLYYLPLVIECLLLIPLLRLLWRWPLVSWAWIVLTVTWWSFLLYGQRWTMPGSPVHRAALWMADSINEETALPMLVFPLFGMMCAGQRVWREFLVKTPAWVWWLGVAAGIALHCWEANYLMPIGFEPAALSLKLGRLMTGVCIFALVVRQPLMRDPFPKVSHYAFGLHFMHPAIILLLLIIEKHLLGQPYFEWRVYVVPMLVINYLLTFWITFAICLLLGRFKRLEFLIV